MDVLNQITAYLSEGSIFRNILFALLILIVGWWLSGVVARIVEKVLLKKDFDKTLVPFLKNTVLWLMRVVVFVMCAATFGIETTSLVALLGAVGLAIGMALQGSLGNLAGGVMLLIFKPFRVDDFISAQGESGFVEEIQLFSTVIVTLDGKTIFLPNGALSSGNITNVSLKPERRVDIDFGIAYTDDIDKARKIIMDQINADSRILKDPAPDVPLLNLGESSVDLQSRTWVKSDDYWGVYFDLRESVKKAFDREGISIPFPQIDIHYNQIDN